MREKHAFVLLICVDYANIKHATTAAQPLATEATPLDTLYVTIDAVVGHDYVVLKGT